MNHQRIWRRAVTIARVCSLEVLHDNEISQQRADRLLAPPGFDDVAAMFPNALRMSIHQKPELRARAVASKGDLAKIMGLQFE
ncbi:hypothetical protein [Bradyrhizobium lablabi]|uniref:hypothetical protein n=1 Tax=Bradyrhizobium lablabi TaxID=722472 RepID=UPI0007096F94|nr:hypothetical protein [Bradyrhizobium lablabi]